MADFTIDPTEIQTPAAAPAGRPAPPDAEQLKVLAAQFEAVLLGQMLRQMRDSMFDERDRESKESGFGGGPLFDQVYTEIGFVLGRAGGVGLADALGGALAREAAMPGGGRAGGLMLPPLPIDTGTRPLVLPEGRITSAYGWRQDPLGGARAFHAGTDIAMPVGSDVRAAQAGEVESVGETPGYGLAVVVRHAGGLATRYAHLSEATVKVGDVVAPGQVIAKSGSSGKSTGPHLHFEVLSRGQLVDPAALVETRGRW